MVSNSPEIRGCRHDSGHMQLQIPPPTHDLFSTCLQAYYTSFASVAFVVYFLRTRKGYRSLPEAIHDRHGAAYSIVTSSSELRASYISVAMLEPESPPNPC